MAELERLEFEEVRMRGQTARRTVRHFGVDYEYQAGTITPGEPLPPRATFALELEPRSAYGVGGAARAEWEHSIPPTRALRYSLTFRTLKRA